ncbi:Apurinic endonuclease-redox protein [Durusdinium trenchii]|uniref:Apurinic endonuclease-redox protein n=1 Tax=Durusdinium trenchii TaxID=1381693 RepID=A0ABP0JM50_9DINO
MATSHGCRWFEGIMRCDSGSIYPENLWKESFSSFHRAGITWEALAVTKRHIGKDSNFHRELENYLQLGEKCKDMYLRAVYSKCYAALSINHGCEHWSFASARALSVRFAAAKTPSRTRDRPDDGRLGKKKARSRFRTWASEHVDRFLGRQHLIGGARYTCGPLQGLASLAAILKDAELIQVVLQLMEKDIRRYQLSDSNLGPLQGSNEEFELLSSHLEGSFFRDEEQLRLEDRKTLRVDDTAMWLGE